ncbi:hypothetical protein A2533_04175 [Candidatus Falkowbacteria bacterium RIFOXYD2_FULL_35_9]|uniref:Uncharacterized protein n=1 Tax=Candidatus Falkowbacteria bacterium RIFOXYC2_FULL_36_12 TaxID=1798002 RepID=A0A1F5T0M1_9BACT|nr:MAG: hypothetical protein A2300_00540 [Candidatus Falkowbacteria bacterium RIFOXYB2_FULL_35_7]OGF32504.1 MAG: hypothetical protein A2478_02620 [Candidatus Falkowbacteria bacterium RIFOXYC2_FULL_36_12]OGF34574.1 MAG: hypothetical protein A2223_04235 [Candidatus Falkowbacteria bacterium RIFOXYA2_FULL_35_8]OGF48539.1 MAG: hypothetical protein A2533_04175 [Candidatus Falkowbacteria bacterium RIFOXYD2_FULL_35_9]
MNFEKPNETDNNSAEHEAKKFIGEATINGHEIVCTWYGREYEMHFPQIELSGAEEKGVYDQNIRITENVQDAEFVFEKTKKWAEEEDDVHELYKRVQKLAKSL